MGNEAQFVSLIGVPPVPAPAGKTMPAGSPEAATNADNALHQVVLSAWTRANEPKSTGLNAPLRAKVDGTCCGA
jgi:hypothetical protein